MGKKKLTTEEILASLRSKAGGGSKSEEAAAPEESAEAAHEETAQPEKKAPAAKPKSPGKTPSSTADILAAARAQAKGGSEEAAPAPSKPAASGGAPKSTADILAAARAASGKGGGEASKAAPKAKAGASKASAPAGERPSVQEMLKAAKSGKPIEAGSSKPTPVIPKKPVLPPKGKKGADVPRRGVLAALILSPFALAWTAMASAAGIFTLGLARFMMPNTLVEPPSKFKVGPVSDYPADAVVTKWKAQFGIWVVNVEWAGKREIYALASVCTHLGCTPNWLEGEQKFKCPCHGSGFYKNGINFEGPAPRPLERMGIRVAEDGMVEVDKGQKFQEEMGQWSDPASFIEVV